MALPLRIGSFVRYNSGTSTNTSLGRVNAVETYEDEHGRRVWWVVRWIDPEDGAPMKDEHRYHENELEVIENATV